MTYYRDDELLIRTIRETDAKTLCEEEILQGWKGVTEEKYRARLRDQASGKAIALIAEYEGNVAGYINVYERIEGDRTYCRIVDFGVLEKYRRRGIGSRLMDVAEQIAAEHSDTAYLGVGLHEGYGSAQRMYIKRGYIPDGRGVWYGGRVCKPYEAYCNDDDLTLHLSKKLR